MINFDFSNLSSFFSSNQFMPHGHCYLWKPTLLWLNAGTDALIFLSYLAISVMLIVLVVKLKAIPFQMIYVLFGTFIFACGLTHLMEIFNIWTPSYWLSGAIKLITAIASVGTAIALPGYFPKIVTLLQNTTLLRETELKLVHDIQKRKQIEENLKTAVADANKANATKSQFLANMSHEIRTPMHIIMGIAQILEESPLNDEQKKQVNMFKKAGNNLLNIINDILDISKIESGNLIIKNTIINFNNILEDIVDLCMSKALAKNLELTFKINNNVPIEVVGDDTRIKQILINLVSNAIKFTEKGSITITIENNLNSNKKGNFYFSVTDTGIGISPTDSQRLFQPFSQAQSTMTKSYGGTGLGLAISKRLAELMGGEIWLFSKEDVGSTFCFTLTCEIINKPQVIKPKEQKLPEIANSQNEILALKILLVDDLEENRILLKAFLKNTRYKIAEAANGAIAVESVKQESFDIILMDMQMPVLDGYSATQQIRIWEQLNHLPRTPIIALTAYALAEEREKSVAAGCDNHITKPIKKADLLKLLSEFRNENTTKPDLKSSIESITN